MQRIMKILNPNVGGDYFLLQRFLKPGRYHIFPYGGSYTDYSLETNCLEVIPIVFYKDIEVNSIAIHVLAAAIGAVRLGIYSDSGDIYPGNLVIDAGEVDVSTTGLKEITGLTTKLLKNKLYWLAIVSNTTVTIVGQAIYFQWCILGLTTTFNTTILSYYRANFPYGNLPLVFPEGAFERSGIFPRIGLQFS